MGLLKRRSEVVRVETALARSERVDELLAELVRIGRPRLSQMDDGEWHANLTVPHETLEIKLRSKFDHASPQEALRELLEKARAAGVVA